MQNFQPIDIAPATDSHKTNGVPEDRWEHAPFGFRSAILELRGVNSIPIWDTHENAKQTHQPLRNQVKKGVRKGRTPDGKRNGILTDPDDGQPNRPPQEVDSPYLCKVRACGL